MRKRTQLFAMLIGVLATATTVVAQDWLRPESRDRGQEFNGFLQPDDLYWRPFALPSVALAEYKLLSFDDTSRARTQLLKVPPGWTQTSGYHSANLELFVVEGGITLNDKLMTRYSYANLPAGYAHSISSADGATILQWWAGEPDFVRSAQSKPGTDLASVIEEWSYGDAPSVGPSDIQGFGTGDASPRSPIRLKVLRHDEKTGAMTWIVTIPGGGPFMNMEGSGANWLSNSGWEEGFLLAGDMTLAECLPVGQVAGTYAPHGYFFRPANVRHGGPSEYSKDYAVWLMRSQNIKGTSVHDSCTPPATQQ